MRSLVVMQLWTGSKLALVPKEKRSPQYKIPEYREKKVARGNFMKWLLWDIRIGIFIQDWATVAIVDIMGCLWYLQKWRNCEKTCGGKELASTLWIKETTTNVSIRTCMHAVFMLKPAKIYWKSLIVGAQQELRKIRLWQYQTDSCEWAILTIGIRLEKDTIYQFFAW